VGPASLGTPDASCRSIAHRRRSPAASVRPSWALAVPSTRSPGPRLSHRSHPVIKHEPVCGLGGYDRAELLDRPVRRRMLGHIPMDDRRVPTSSTTKTKRARKRTVTGMKKSQARTACARFRTNVAQRCDGRPPRGRCLCRRYRPTVRGEPASPSFRSSSFAIRSSPLVGFARCHGDDQPLQGDRNRRSARPGLPPPEEPPAQAVPPDERLRLDDRQHRAPVKQSG
jgi:hypothetical protein